jgi:hypothetical protein
MRRILALLESEFLIFSTLGEVTSQPDNQSAAAYSLKASQLPDSLLIIT